MGSQSSFATRDSVRMAKPKWQQRKAAIRAAAEDEEHQRRLGATAGAVDTSAGAGESLAGAGRPAKRKLAADAAEQPSAKARRTSRLLESLADDADADDDISDTSEDEEPAAHGFKPATVTKGPFRNKEKVLVLTSRGIPSR